MVAEASLIEDFAEVRALRVSQGIKALGGLVDGFIPLAATDVLSRLCLIEPTLRSEEHTSELQSLMRISYAVFCLKKKKKKNQNIRDTRINNKRNIQMPIQKSKKVRKLIHDESTLTELHDN